MIASAAGEEDSPPWHSPLPRVGLITVFEAHRAVVLRDLTWLG